MNLYEYQTAAERTMGEHTTAEERLLNAALGICGEAAEIAEIGRNRREELLEECGDLLWYVAQLHKACGENIGSSIIRVMPWSKRSTLDEMWNLSGVLADLVKKRFFHGKHVEDMHLASISRGLVQVVSTLLRPYGYTVEDACIHNVEKLLKRHPNGFSHESANARADKV